MAWKIHIHKKSVASLSTEADAQYAKRIGHGVWGQPPQPAGPPPGYAPGPAQGQGTAGGATASLAAATGAQEAFDAAARRAHARMHISERGGARVLPKCSVGRGLFF